MNAPATPTDGILIDAQLRQLVPSKTQPRVRRGFDEASLNELAATIRAVGVAQPILIRKIDEERYEIVCGERRWRAANIAGLATIPALLRSLTDFQVLQIQLIENVQREDLDELEEAEGYEKLMHTQNADGQNYTVDMIAAAQGVKRSTIYARLKLLALPQEARQAFYDGKLDASRALIIARIPVQKIQLKVLEEAVKPSQYDKNRPLHSFRDLKELVQREYMLDLGRKVFDIKDATLLPKAGACTDCPNRTGNQPEIFDDMGDDTDICTDPTCFALKKTAAIKRLQEQAKDNGHDFISADKAKKIIPYNWGDTGGQLQQKGYAQLNAKVPDDSEGRTWNQIIKQAGLLDPRVAKGDEQKFAVQKIEIQNPHKPTEIIQAVNIEAATKALREAGFEITLKADARNQNNGGADKKKEQAKIDEINAVRLATFEAIHEHIEQEMMKANQALFSTIAYRLANYMIDQLLDYGEENDVAAVFRLYIEDELTGEDRNPAPFINDFRANIFPKMQPQQHFQIMAELTLAGQLEAWHAGSKEPEDMNTFARELGLAVHEIKQAAIKQHKADVVEKAKAEAAKEENKPAVKKAGKAKAAA